MSTYINTARMHARGDGIEMTITSEDDISVCLVLSNEALWNLVEFIAKKAPRQYDMIKRIIQQTSEEADE